MSAEQVLVMVEVRKEVVGRCKVDKGFCCWFLVFFFNNPCGSVLFYGGIRGELD